MNLLCSYNYCAMLLDHYQCLKRVDDVLQDGGLNCRDGQLGVAGGGASARAGGAGSARLGALVPAAHQGAAGARAGPAPATHAQRRHPAQRRHSHRPQI